MCIVRFFRGWIKPENMSREAWLPHWKMEAIEANKEGYDMVVFVVPRNNTSLIEEIEKLLQEKLKE